MAFAELSVANEWYHEVEPELLIMNLDDETVVQGAIKLMNGVGEAMQNSGISKEESNE